MGVQKALYCVVAAVKVEDVDNCLFVDSKILLYVVSRNPWRPYPLS